MDHFFPHNYSFSLIYKKTYIFFKVAKTFYPRHVGGARELGLNMDKVCVTNKTKMFLGEV